MPQLDATWSIGEIGDAARIYSVGLLDGPNHISVDSPGKMIWLPVNLEKFHYVNIE